MKTLRLVLGVVAAMATLTAHAANRPAGFVTVCTESKPTACPSVPANTNVAYGRSDRFTYKVISGSFTCQESTFGAGTRVSGGTNECSIRSGGSSSSAPSTSSSSSRASSSLSSSSSSTAVSSSRPSSSSSLSSSARSSSISSSASSGGAGALGVVGRLFTGYQGWFSAQGDGSPNGSWIHWSKNGSAPAPGSVNFDLYPDLREYTQLYQTGLANLGNGSPAKLFSSYDPETVNKHFQWMQQYNIDGAALQRFGASTSTNDNWRANRDSVAVKVKNAAQTYGRAFYVMYDTSGLSASNWAAAIKADWTNNVVGAMNLPGSSAYARQNGKIVVCIWGIGFTDRPGTAAEAADLIAWFKNQNVYVIGGIPTHWRTGTGDSKPGFTSVYESLNMISPWFVGRFSGTDGADHYMTNQWGPDFTRTQQLGIAYQPVIWPGFSWFNLHGGPKNQIPRLHGDFMWRQAYNLKRLGINTAYVAMFDEYDEATAIAKGAENSSMIPSNNYFLTLDADGVALSSDFYLRLTGDINRMLKGSIGLTAQHPTPHQ